MITVHYDAVNLAVIVI